MQTIGSKSRRALSAAPPSKEAGRGAFCIRRIRISRFAVNKIQYRAARGENFIPHEKFFLPLQGIIIGRLAKSPHNE